jgi:hypothetical protein
VCKEVPNEQQVLCEPAMFQMGGRDSAHGRSERGKVLSAQCQTRGRLSAVDGRFKRVRVFLCAREVPNWQEAPCDNIQTKVVGSIMSHMTLCVPFLFSAL